MAEHVCFEGNHLFEVEEGIRLIVGQKNGKLSVRKEPLQEGPLWQYSWEKGIALKKEKR